MKQKIAEAIVRSRLLWMALLTVLAVLAAFSLRNTKINYDLTSYLAENTATKRGLNLMNGEFTPTSSMSLVLIDAGEEETRQMASRIAAMEPVLMSAYDPAEGVRERDGHIYRLISITLDASHESEMLDAVEAQVGDMPHLLGGAAKESRDLQDCIFGEMPVVMVVSCAIVFLILLSMTTSYLEPFVFFAVIAVSILLNMGSNWIFDSVSYITFAVAAILQLALAMDYSIMLMNAFDRLRDQGVEREKAMIRALSAAFMPIASSALTTVAGMMALVFMSFTIGYDIGIVLAKGIVLSMLTVFLLMPGLLLLLSPLLDRTRHKPLAISGRGLVRLSNGLHGALPIALILLIFTSAFLQHGNVYTYTVRNIEKDSRTIGTLFGQSNQLVVLFPRDDSDEGMEKQRQLVDRLSAVTGGGRPVVQKVFSMVTTGKAAVTYYDAAGVAQMLGRSEASIQSAFNILNIEPPIRGDELVEKLSNLMHAISFLLPADATSQLEEAQSLLNTANMVFNGPHYSRALVMLDVTPADPFVHDTVAAFQEILRDLYGEDTAMAGQLLALDDIAGSFSKDMMRVSAITILFVFVIVLFSFRSLVIPLMLVCMIQGAIWINMCFSNWYDGNIFFMCYLICVGLQMGATIDYGILLTSHYRTLRGELAPREAAARAVGLSAQTILTSGMALVTAGFSVGIVSSVFYISSIGTMLARGALVSMAMVLLLLPKLLQWLDRWIVKKNRPTAAVE